MGDEPVRAAWLPAARERYEQFGDAEAGELAPEARSLLLHHGRITDRAYVLLHGLTTTPAQFADFARHVYAGGANVFVPRLPRHGHADRLTETLAGLTEHELTGAAREIVDLSRGLGKQVTIAGFSAGGALAVWIAQHFAVDRVVAIAPFLGVGWVPTRLGTLVSGAALRAPNLFVWWNPMERERHLPLHGYPRYATHAVARVWRLGLGVLDAARRVPPATREIVLVANASETAVNNRAIARLAQAWRAHNDGNVVVHRLNGLPRSHDIVEHQRRGALAPQVLPALLEIVTEGG